MRTRNANPQRAHGVVVGHVGRLRAGSSGIDWEDSTGTVVADATAVTLDEGFLLGDLDDDGALLSIEPGLVSLTTITPAQLTANTDDWDPVDAGDPNLGLDDASVIRASTNAALSVTGLVAPETDRQVILENIGTFNLVLKHNVTSTAANRFLCPNDADLTLQKDSGCFIVYDLTSARWRVIGGDVLTAEAVVGLALTHAHVVSEAHLSDGSSGAYTLDEAFEDGSVIAWNTTSLARLTVTETPPDAVVVSPVGSLGDAITFDYATPIV